MTQNKIVVPEFRVVVGDREDESTWTEVFVRVFPAEQDMAADLIARHKEWPTVQQNPLRFMHAQVYYAMRGRQLYTGNFDQFRTDLIVCASTDDDEEIVPTEPALSAG